MKIGIPKEIKTAEGRVALLPDACKELIEEGHEIWLQEGAGQLSGYHDSEYSCNGCSLARTAEELYQKADLIVKVKEPQPAEYPLLGKRHVLFCFLHLAAEPRLVDALKDSGCTAIAFEGVTNQKGELSILRPMSIIAGKLAVQYASILLHRHHGGKGIVLDGLAGVPRAQVTVLGFGSAGGAAAQYAARLGASVTVIDKNYQKLQSARLLGPNVVSLFASQENITRAVELSDVVIGAVLIPEKRAPVLVSRKLVSKMQAGSVIIDIAVDQGGCIETTHSTSYADPTYVEEGVVHFAVTNIPGAVPRSASQALSGGILESVKSIATGSWRQDGNIMNGLNIDEGRIVADLF